VIFRFSARIAVFACLLILSGCAFVSTEPELKYSGVQRSDIYGIAHWFFEGRIAVKSKNDSWSATIDWNHDQGQEKIKLSGPLGQGAIKVSLDGNHVTIDRGNGHLQTSEDAEAFINKELGLLVPVHFLRFWVAGVPNPDMPYIEVADGFTQASWLCEYKEMVKVENRVLPKKLMVTNGQIKLRLVIDQWSLEGRK
jgi:outer membrane lipoprotein LolB